MIVSPLTAAALLAVAVGATVPGAVVPVRANLSTVVLTDAQRSKIFSWADGAAGTVTDDYTSPAGPPVAETAIDPGPPGAAGAGPGSCAPTIASAKGKLTSGGYLVLQGTCFGPSGHIEITGFPNGNPQVAIQAWTPTAVTAQLPTISGVTDLKMHIKLVTATGGSKSFDANYIAAIGAPITLPSKYITNNVCNAAGVCSSAPHKPIGAHWDYSEATGTDVWTFTIPDHFHLQAIHLVHLKSGPTTTRVINASSSQVTFSVAWQDKQPGDVKTTSAKITTTTCSGGLLETDLTYQLTYPATDPENCYSSTTGGTAVLVPDYQNIYRVEPIIVGPVGVTP